MPASAASLRTQLHVAVIVASLPLGAFADDNEIRLGRYETIRTAAPSEPTNEHSRPEPMVWPDDVVTRGDALQWILTRHGYQLDEHTQRLLTLATDLSALRPHAEARIRPASLRPMLQALLGPAVVVNLDPITRRAVLSFDESIASDTSERDHVN